MTRFWSSRRVRRRLSLFTSVAGDADVVDFAPTATADSYLSDVRFIAGWSGASASSSIPPTLRSATGKWPSSSGVMNGLRHKPDLARTQASHERRSATPVFCHTLGRNSRRPRRSGVWGMGLMRFGQGTRRCSANSASKLRSCWRSPCDSGIASSTRSRSARTSYQLAIPAVATSEPSQQSSCKARFLWWKSVPKQSRTRALEAQSDPRRGVGGGRNPDTRW